MVVRNELTTAPETALDKPSGGGHKCLLSRRQFLLTSGAAATTVMVVVNAGTPEAKTVPGVVATYPRQFITNLSALKADTPFDFSYPDKGKFSESMIVKLDVPAGGGIGAKRDIVAFNYACTHQGGPLAATYQGETKSLGACPLHLSTYDLTRHGIIISGQAYQSLPQVLLELEGDKIYAVGMFGLIFGRHDNLQG